MAKGVIKRIILILFTCPVVLIAGVSAQELLPSLLMPGIPQTTLFNPAYQNESEKLIIGIPVLSGIYGSYNGNVTFNSLFSNGFDYSFQRLYNTLDKEGKLEASAGVSMFFASLKRNNLTFSLNISERIFSEITAPRDLIKFVADGTENYYGSDDNLGSASFDLEHFRVIAPGISKRVNENFDIGIRVKLLFGKLHSRTSNLNITTKTDPVNGDLLLKPEGSYMIAGPFNHLVSPSSDYSTFSANIFPGDYFFQFRNMGLAFDAGINYRPGELTELSISLVDFGFIGFRHNAFLIDFSESLRYSKDFLYQSHSPTEDNYIEPREALKILADSASYIINVNESPERHISYLPFKINFTGKHQFSEKIYGGIASLLCYRKKEFSSLTSLFFHTSTKNRVTLGAGLSLYNMETVMPGAGLSYTIDKYQFFFSSNNILGIIDPTGSKHINLYLGFNLLFDTKK